MLSILRRFWPVALLLLAGLSFGASWLTSQAGPTADDVRLPSPDAPRLQRLLSQAIATAAAEADSAARECQPPAAPDFARFLAECSYPTFVVVGSQLAGWSATGPAPTAADLADARAERLVVTELGDFVVVRRARGAVVVLVYVPLARHYGISNRYLNENDAPALLRGTGTRVRAAQPASAQAALVPSSEQGVVLLGSQGQVVVVVEPLAGAALPERLGPLAWLLLGSVAYAAGWLALAAGWWRRGRTGLAVATLLGPLLAGRLVLLALGLPDAWLESPLFDPRVYAVAGWAPSLGDLLLNGMLALALAGAAYLVSRRYDWPRRARRAPGRWAGPALVGLLLLLLALRGFYASAFSNGQLSLDLAQGMRLSGWRVLLALAVLLHTGAFVGVLYAITQLLAPALGRLPRRPALAGGLALAGALLAGGALLPQPLLLDAGLAVLSLGLVAAGGLGPAADGYPLRHGRYVLLVLLGLSAALGATALYGQFGRQLVFDKQRLAGNLLTDNDLQGEFLLGQRMRQLAQDPAVARLFVAMPVRTDVLRRRVGRYLHHYFDKYEEDIDLFDVSGRALVTDDNDTLTFDRAREVLSRTATATDQNGIYLLQSANSFSSRRYVAVVPVGLPPSAGIGPPAPVGTILLTLRLRQLASYSVLPELLVDQKFFQPGLTSGLSYAGYADGRLLVSQGDFDYANRLSVSLLRDPRLYTTGVVVGGFHHLGVREASGPRVAVVTTATYSLADWGTNFAGLLLLQGLGWLLAAGAAGAVGRLRQGRRGQALNLSARIQLLLNVGVLVPLLVVSVAVASQVVAGYRRDLRRTYERRGRIALESFTRDRALPGPARAPRLDSAGRPALTVLVRRVASLTETDLDLYDAGGRLLVSSQPLIYEAGLLGPLLNPQAVVDLRERGLSRTLLTEQAGSLAFTSLYLPVRAPADADGQPTGPVLGYLGIPFFDSQKELDGKLTELFATILRIFTGMFLAFLGLAFLATRRLTAPLGVLTQRLTRTTLTGQNEALAYGGHPGDEIGLLVGEYNAMLGKLEASRRALAAQEKEAAWREMARQVAHEIKNPLTPMKLSLQYLQKAIAERRPNTEELIARIAQTLLTQIDVLADIATSFSTFTNLPAMRPVRLDVAQVLRQCAELFGENSASAADPLPASDLPIQHLTIQLPESPVTVFADESLLVRTFNNLLLNARQAVPAGRPAHLAVGLSVANGQARITIQDNGTGIAKAVRERVFQPNFTTKATGSGIGLAVARRGIESAGGRLWFETREGAGTTFFIELPLAG